MPLTGPIPQGHSFFCPSCGALYAVTYSRLSSGSDNNSTAKCVVCGQVMAEWNSTDVPTFKLVHHLKMPKPRGGACQNTGLSLAILPTWMVRASSFTVATG
jgi:hypothetical protein